MLVSLGIIPLLPLIGAGLSAATGFFGNKGSNNSNEKINQANIDWQREALGINKQNSLDMWNLQNEYNTPQAQMRRFEQAGLNPNLIYGQGNSGNASAVDVPKLGTPDLHPNNYSGLATGLNNSLMQYSNLSLNKAQVENVNANTLVANASAVAKLTDTARTKQQMALTDNLWDSTVEKARADMQSVEEDVDRKSSENVLLSKLMRANVPFDKAVAELAATKLGNEKSQVLMDNLRKSGKLQDLEIAMRKAGMSYSDPLWSRVLMRLIGGDNIDSIIDSVRGMFKSLNPFN